MCYVVFILLMLYIFMYKEYLIECSTMVHHVLLIKVMVGFSFKLLAEVHPRIDLRYLDPLEEPFLSYTTPREGFLLAII